MMKLEFQHEVVSDRGGARMSPLTLGPGHSSQYCAFQASDSEVRPLKVQPRISGLCHNGKSISKGISITTRESTCNFITFVNKIGLQTQNYFQYITENSKSIKMVNIPSQQF